ncbi:DJ-1/PfpI family protein [Mycolicibacterium sp. HS_4_1]
MNSHVLKELEGRRIAILAADGVERVELDEPRAAVEDAAVTFVRSGKPVAAICHGPWTLVEADVVRGRKVTSYPSVRTDLRNAGATVVDQAVCIDGNLITSRSPSDLPAFCEAITEALASSPAQT